MSQRSISKWEKHFTKCHGSSDCGFDNMDFR